MNAARGHPVFCLDRDHGFASLFGKICSLT